MTLLLPTVRIARIAAACLLVVGIVAPSDSSRAQTTPLFTFAQVSDSQPTDALDWAVFEQVLDTLTASGQSGALIPRRVDFVLFAGDLVDNGGDPTDWLTFVQTIDSRLTLDGIPYLAVPGNHDTRNGGTANYEQFIADSGVWDTGTDVVAGQNGNVVSPGWIGIRFIGFNDSLDGEYNVVSAEDLADIDQRVLQAGAADENVFLIGHHHHDDQSRIPLASIFEDPNVVGYIRGHSGNPHARRGLSGISNPDVWDLNSNAIVLDGAILYYEVFASEIRVYVIELLVNDSVLPAPVTIPLVHAMRPAGPTIAPTADFDASPTAGPAPLEVSFSDLSDGPPTSWLWDFGDGTSSDERDPVHTYMSPGSYDVSLSVSNAAGSDTSTRTALVAVGPAPPSTTYLPVADARVRNTRPTTNFGAEDLLRIRTGTDVYDSHLKFDVSGLSGSSVLSARLRLYVTDGSSDGGTLYETTGDWQELTVTWDNAPTAIGAPLASAGGVGIDAWIELDVSDVVTGDGTYSFVLTSDSSDSAYFSSREGAHPPELVVQTDSLAAPQADFTAAPLAGNAPLAVTFSDLSSGPPASWLWDFGDGGSSSEQNPVHSYQQPGLYSVTLTVGNGMGSSTLAKPGYVTVDASAPPQADFAVSPGSGVAPLQVAFTDLSQGPPTSWLWEFGDGESSSEQNPTHTYAAEGSYDVTLSVDNDAGSDSLERTGAVTVLPPSPGATFLPVADARVRAASPGSNYGGDDLLRLRQGEYESYLMFDVSGVGSGVGSAVLRLFVTDGSDDGGAVYETSSDWNELDISWDTAPGASGAPLDAAGSVEAGTWVELDVTDAVSGDGRYAFVLTSTSTNSTYYSSREGADPPELVIGTGAPAAAPVADFSAVPQSGEAPLMVAFTDLSANGPTSWLWDFGDGGSSSSRNPLHVYGSAGVYDVSLTVANGAGSDTRVRAGLVSVTAAADPPPSVAITGPADGTSVEQGTPVTFTASASDDPDGDLSGSVAWSSDRQGALGSGASLTRSDLVVGVHRITATVTDSGGSSASAEIELTVTAVADPPPSIAITGPADGTVTTEGTPITFTGTASDPEEGDLSASIAWSSDKDGPLGVGASVTTATLSKGRHTISATVVDAGGAEASATISVLVKNSRGK